MAASWKRAIGTVPHDNQHASAKPVSALDLGFEVNDVENIIFSPTPCSIPSSSHNTNPLVADNDLSFSDLSSSNAPMTSNPLSSSEQVQSTHSPESVDEADVCVIPVPSSSSLVNSSPEHYTGPEAHHQCWGPSAQFHRILFILALGFVSVAAASVVVVLKTSNKNAQVAVPSTDYSSAMELQKSRFAHLRKALGNYSNPTAFLVPASPQYRALEWLSTVPQDPTYWEDDSPITRLVQRYALITISFSFNRGIDQWFDVEMDEKFAAYHECQWLFITCNAADNTVTHLYLEKRRLNGAFPEELGALSDLQSLVAYGNTFVGNLLPRSVFGKLTNLKELSLNLNGISHSIPTEIGLLSNSLTLLDLSFNFIYGTLPDELKALTKLAYLDVSRNDLQGQVFDFVPFWPNLETLIVGMTKFTGTLPPGFMQSMTNLQGLDVRGLPQFPHIPTTIGHLTNLEFLVFGQTINGEEIMRTLDDNGSLMTVMKGTIPTEIGQLTNLFLLNIDSTSIDGSLPTELGLLTNLEYMLFNNCNISSTIPTEISKLSNLKDLSVAGNRLTGSVPPEIGSLTDLEILRVERNSGMVLPDEVCHIDFLSHSCDQICYCCSQCV